MTTMFIEKINIKDLEEAIANSTALLALVGAGDLALEKILAARADLADRATSFDPKSTRDQAQATIANRVGALQTELKAAPERIQAIPEMAQEWPAKAQSLFADVLSTAFSTYGELAERGKVRVDQARREMPGGVEVEVEVKPVSRPATSTARKATATKKPVAKKTTTKKTKTTTKPAAKQSAAKQATASTSSTSTTSTTSSAPAEKAAQTPNTTASTEGTTTES